MTQNHQIEADVRKYIDENILFSSESPYGNDTSLLREGILDSIGVMELVTFIGQTYSISVLPEEVLPENFDSLTSMARYVRSKQTAPA